MFKIGDKVVCIDNNHRSRLGGGYVECYLTDGKVYEIKRITPTGINLIATVFYIKNDKGIKKGYNRNRFISLIKHRKQKLEKICSKLVTG